MATPRRQPFAKLAKPFVYRDGLRKAIHKHEVTRRDLYALFRLLGLGQKTGKRTLRFKSEYELLRKLEWGDHRQDYKALRHALDIFTKTRMHFPKGLWPKERTERTFERVWRVKRNDSGLSVSFDPDFWEANDVDRKYVKVDPRVIDQLKYPHTIVLHLWLACFPAGLKMSTDKLARHVGLYEEKRKRLRQSLQGCLGIILAETDVVFSHKFSIDEDGNEQIEVRKLVAYEDETTTG